MMDGFEKNAARLVVAVTLATVGPQIANAHLSHQDSGSPGKELILAQADRGERSSEAAIPGVATSGSGEWTFRVASEYQLPPEAESRIGGAHGGIAVDPKTHDLFFALKGIGIVRVGPEPGDSEIIDGFPELSNGNLHNVTLFYHEGRPFLSCPDNQSGHVYLLNLRDETLATLSSPKVNQYYRDGGSFNPTDTEFVASTLYVTDGYSSGNFVLKADPFSAMWLEDHFGGKGTNHGQFGICHGITYNPVEESLDISDRPHSRVERFGLDDNFRESVALPEGARPVDVDFYNGRMVVGCLLGPGSSKPAPVYILDRHGEIISTIRPKKDLGLDKAVHMHDAVWWAVPSKETASEKVMIAVTAWNPGDFFVLERTVTSSSQKSSLERRK